MKLLVLDNYESFSLVPYFSERLKGEHEVVKMGNIYDERMWSIFRRVDPDVVFVDFCDRNAIVLTNRVHELPKVPKIVIRLHGFEAFGNQLRAVKWDTVSTLVMVSPFYKKIVQEAIGNVGVDMRVIFNGLDTKKFKLQDESQIDDDSIAYVSYLNRKKGMALFRTLMATLPDKKFHIGGVFQEEPVRLYLQDLKLENVTYHGWVNTAEFLKGKRYILSTSVSESFGMTIAEGMLMGLTPLVHAWPGAKGLWPEDCVWTTFDDFKKIEPKDPKWCRAWVEERYSMDKCIEEFIKILK